MYDFEESNDYDLTIFFILPINPFKKSCCGYFINASLNGPKFCVLYYIHTCILSLLQCSTPIVWNSVVHFLHCISF